MLINDQIRDLQEGRAALYKQAAKSNRRRLGTVSYEGEGNGEATG